MISVYFSWSNRSLDTELAHRFKAALEAGHKLGAQSGTLGRAVVAKTTHQRNWRPARTPRGEAVLFDGYIENRTELQSLLGEKFQNDDAYYAAAYTAWGDAADLKVLGQFAAIIFHPEEKLVRLARSPIQAPPLHIWNDNDRIIASSTPRVIFSTGEIDQEIDEQKIADSLYLNYHEEERGWFKGVRRVPRGSKAIVSPGDIKISRYYDVSNLPEIRLSRDDDYVEAANALFKEATRTALGGFSQPAVSVSGGYDSQAVAAYAATELKGKPLLALTSVPESGWDGNVAKTRFGDESMHVLALCNMYPSIEMKRIDAKGLYFDHMQTAMFMLAGSPPRNAANLHWIHEVRSQAKSHGCDVVLTGTMGNATFSFAGNGALTNWLLCGEWGKLFREFRATRGNLPEIRRFTSETIMPLLPEEVWLAIMRLRNGRQSDPYESWCPINPAYAAEMRVEERAREIGYDSSYQPLRSPRTYRAAMLNNAASEGGDIIQAFELLHGLHMRDPTAYRPLFEFCLGIPDDQYLRHGQKRWLARRMLKNKIPELVLNEKRRGLQAADWHLRMGRQVQSLKAEIDCLSEDQSMVRRLNLVSLRKSLNEWPSGGLRGRSQEMRLLLAISRGLTTARFINYLEGKNANLTF